MRRQKRQLRLSRRFLRRYRRLLRREFQMCQFFNVVHETKQFPLRIDFRAPTEREAVEALVVAQVRKHRFDGRKALRVLLAALVGVDALSHLPSV